MDKSSTAPARAELTFDNLTAFEPTVVSGGTRLYNNGLQQVAVQILLRPTLEMEFNPLTVGELRSVRLVDYNTEEELSKDWAIAYKPGGYTYFPEPGHATSPAAPASDDDEWDPPAPVNGRYVFTLYISTTATAGISRKFALAITRNDGLVAVTNGKQQPPTEGLDESVTLLAVKSPTYHIDNYTFEKNIVRETPFPCDGDRLREDGGTPVFVAYYYLGVVGNDGVPIGLKTMEVESAGMIQWHDKVPGETYASYTGYGAPNSTDAIYNTEIVLGANHTPEKVISEPIEDKGTIILAGDVNIPFHQGSAINHAGPCQITAIDEYGNTHALKVRFKDSTQNGRFDLILFK